ncbi:PREDICTED: disintegrin and metalloproteinase domain-containing protein 21-like [Galeopterus variegatus]|uniref:Disintegrin and metalloproteinase domain-containing protein 21-like n=1 Tax=Galeopterus variegatus TaxID=482537 RepID=A0ABM0RKE6_GALVR|nr:PREDICTED: disintegrin and metalloproteinase domain-containing protein 21-like [Galeopterus variegatus]
MRLAEGQVILKAAVWLLGFWALLAPVQSSQGRPSWRYVSSEVVIPRKEMHHGKGVQVPGWLSYSLRFGGQRHVIHMRRRKLLWPRHLLVMTQDDQGALQMDFPYIPPDCYYLGYLEDIPLSMVTVDTCYGGLEGIMKLDDLAYEIKPLKDSSRFEHVVSQIVADTNAMGPMYRLGHRDVIDPLFSVANASGAPRISSTLYSSHEAIVKGHIQAANSIYRIFNNVTSCVTYLIRISRLLDSFLHNLHFGYYFYLMTIYNQNDPVSSYNDFRVPGSPMYNYYKQVFFDNYQPHSSVIIIKDRPHEADFEPDDYGLCSATGLIFTGELGRHYLLLSIIVTNQIGRTIGLAYDSPDDCVCQRRTSCIMFRFPGLTDAFSNCSYLHVQNIVNHRRWCVFHQSRRVLNETDVRCGNYRVDRTEQCDCGSFKQCYDTACCTSDCQLTPGSACHVGACCTNCTYSPIGTLCRPIRNICDLPEYCQGDTFTCPDDFYMQDGTPCTEEGYCYKGNCTDRSMHCKEIFGAHAHNADETCYSINTVANRFGHCFRYEESFTYGRCDNRDRMCGRLQCTNVTHIPRLQEHVSFHHSLIDGVPCLGVDTHRSTGSLDVGHVRAGTPCAPDMFCKDNHCNETMSSLNYDCVPEKCSFRGVCNNRKNCHCHVGWDPPLCQRKGAGGSQDSGPPPRRVRSVTQSKQALVYLRLVLGRIYALIAVLLIGVATNVRSISTTTVKEGTYSEPEGKKIRNTEPE